MSKHEKKTDSKPRARRIASVRRAPLIAAGVIAAAALGTFAYMRMPLAISEERFPDQALRQYILDDIDANHDGRLSNTEANAVTSMVISDATEVSGLDAFPALKILVVRGDGVHSVDVSDMQGLETLDVAGAQNLSELTIRDDLNLQTVNLRGTSIKSIDLSQAGHLEQVFVDPGTQVTGLDKGTRKQKLITHFEQTSEADAAKNYSVDADYSENGVLTRKTVSGAVEADISYAYNDAGILQGVSVKGSELANEWTVTQKPGEIDAEGEGGTYIRRSYDAMGRLASVDLNTAGASGPITCTLQLGYDARGLLNALTAQTPEGDKTYRIQCNGAALVEVISDGTTVRYWNGNQQEWGSEGDMVAGELSSSGSSVHSTNSDGGFSASVSQDDEGGFSHVVGKYGQSENADRGRIWGRTVSSDGSGATSYDADYETFGTSAHVNWTPAPVFMRDKTDPSYVSDYWLLDDVESAVRVAMLEAEASQSLLNSTDPIVDEVDEHKQEEYLKQYTFALPDVAKELGVSEDDLRYAFYQSGDADALPLMAVSADASGETVDAIYALKGGEVAMVLQKEGGGELHICGGGFYRATSPDGDTSVFHFNGATMDPIAMVEGGFYTNLNSGATGSAASDTDTDDLCAAYPAADATLVWRKAKA